MSINPDKNIGNVDYPRKNTFIDTVHFIKDKNTDTVNYPWQDINNDHIYITISIHLPTKQLGLVQETVIWSLS